MDKMIDQMFQLEESPYLKGGKRRTSTLARTKSKKEIKIELKQVGLKYLFRTEVYWYFRTTICI